MIADEEDFIGRGWSFPPAFNLNEGTVEMVTQETDIKQSLYILMTTMPCERLMRPEYGCALQPYVFEDMDNNTAAYLKSMISDAILYGEPRIKVNQIQIDDSEAGDGVRRILIEFTICQTNTRTNMVIPFCWQEGTNIKPLK